ncbi:unnamed protein product [Owenia fusiformis]|uniref:Uncharacterized protein n=1 Tax=Owenia fusiformis TaxID=6347 RepID=A0A8S4Q2V8_OWEFU|nr:unnamed protein product [Owenia fusiformis]
MVKMYSFKQDLSEKRSQSQQKIIEALGTMDDDKDTTGERKPNLDTKQKILKNLFILTIGSMLVNIPSFGLISLQSSLNNEGGLGVAAISCQWAAFGLTSLLIAPSFFNTFGARKSFFVSWVLFLTFTIANAFPSWYSLIPTNILIGIGTGINWAANPIVVTSLALDYAYIKKTSETRPIIDSFQGLMLAGANSARIWGEIISASILLDDTLPIDDNINNSTAFEDVCGSEFCPNSNLTGTKIIQPPDEKKYLLVGIYSGCIVLGLLTLFIIDPHKPTKTISAGKRILKTIKLQGNPKMMPLIALFVYNGFRQSLISGDFNQAFISCELGVGYIGLAMLCMGITNALGAGLIGVINRWIPRQVFVIIAASINMLTMVTMLLWEPSADQFWLFLTTSCNAWLGTFHMANDGKFNNQHIVP